VADGCGSSRRLPLSRNRNESRLGAWRSAGRPRRGGGPQQFIIGAIAICRRVMLLCCWRVCGNTAKRCWRGPARRYREIRRPAKRSAPRPWRVVQAAAHRESLSRCWAPRWVSAIAVGRPTDMLALPMIGAVPFKFRRRQRRDAGVHHFGLGLIAARFRLCRAGARWRRRSGRRLRIGGANYGATRWRTG